MGEEDNQLSDLDLAKQKEKETFEEQIYFRISQMEEDGKDELLVDGMIIKMNEKGEYDFYLPGIDTGKAYITATHFATVSDRGISYYPENIKQYQAICKSQGIDPKLPEGMPDIELLTERQGDDSKAKEHEAEEQEREPKEEKDEEETEQKEEKEENTNENEERKLTLKKLPPNALKLNKHRMADPRTKVGDELEKATGEKGVEFYIAPVSKNNNLEYRLFIERNGVYKEVELPTPRGKNPTDNVMRMNENGIDDKTAVSILYIGEDRAITVFDGGPYAKVDIANMDYNGEYSSINIENSTEPGKVGYADGKLREAGGNTVDARKSVSEKRVVYLTMKELEQRGVPNEINPAKDQDGIAMYEISAGLDNLKAELKAEFTNRLIQEEGKREVDAKVIADKMVENMVGNDKGVEVDYETAKINAEQEYAEEQKQPGDPRPGSRW